MALAATFISVPARLISSRIFSPSLFTAEASITLPLSSTESCMLGLTSRPIIAAASDAPPFPNARTPAIHMMRAAATEPKTLYAGFFFLGFKYTVFLSGCCSVCSPIPQAFIISSNLSGVALHTAA